MGAFCELCRKRRGCGEANLLANQIESGELGGTSLNNFADATEARIRDNCERPGKARRVIARARKEAAKRIKKDTSSQDDVEGYLRKKLGDDYEPID